MSNANLGDSTSPVNDKTESIVEKFAEQFTSVPGDVSRMVKVLDELRGLIERYTDHAAVEKRHALDVARTNPPTASRPPMGGKPLGKHLSRKAMRASREEYAIAVLVKSQGKADIHEIAAAVARAYGGCNFGSLYKYERFNQLYKAAQEMQRQQAREQKKRGFVTTDGDVVGVENPDQ